MKETSAGTASSLEGKNDNEQVQTMSTQYCMIWPLINSLPSSDFFSSLSSIQNSPLTVPFNVFPTLTSPLLQIHTGCIQLCATNCLNEACSSLQNPVPVIHYLANLLLKDSAFFYSLDQRSKQTKPGLILSVLLRPMSYGGFSFDSWQKI